jgi:hypothetical protein
MRAAASFQNHDHQLSVRNSKVQDQVSAVTMAESPYRVLQRQAKAAGLPANRSAKELERMLAEGGAAGSPATSKSTATRTPKRASSGASEGTTTKVVDKTLLPGEWRPDYPVRYAPLFPFIGNVLQVKRSCAIVASMQRPRCHAGVAHESAWCPHDWCCSLCIPSGVHATLTQLHANACVPA